MMQRKITLPYSILIFLFLIGNIYAQSPCTTTVITSIAPASGPANTVVTLTGSGFSLGAGTTAVQFNGTDAAGFTVVSDTTIKAVVPASATTGTISIITNGCQAVSATFTVLSSNCTTTLPGEIYISELYDQRAGSGGMIELYNPSNATITFNGAYVLQRYANINDNTPSAGYILTLTGSIDPESTYLVACTTPNQVICAAPPEDASFGSGFNGNDKFELLKNNVVIDRVNVPFTGPGFTLIRNPDAVAPTPTYNVNDWNNFQHDASATNTFCSDLGNHNADPAPPAITITTQPQNAVICEGNNTTYTVAISNATGFTYQWKVLNAAGVWVNIVNDANYSGATTASLTLSAIPLDFNGNQYYCQITSASCALISNAAQLTVSPLPIVIVTQTQPDCTTATGSIQITPTVGEGLTYSINGTTFQASATFAGLAPGTYTLTIKSASNCISTMPVTVDPAPATPAAPTVAAVQPTCTVTTGTITVTAPTGTGLTYSIDDTNYQASATFANLAPGSYNVTVQNAAGCTSTATVQVINAAPVAPVAPTITAVQPTCAVATGTITVTAPTGTGLTYSINGTNYQASATFANITVGSYNVTVRNADGCTSTATVQVINAAPNAPTAPTATTIQPTCAVATGSITVTAPTGTGLTYSIDGTNYQASATFANLAPGSYNITVQNAAGCTSTATVQVINAAPTTPAAPTVTAIQPTCAVATGTITVTAPSGTDLTYSIDGTNYQASATFANVAQGSYNVTVRNAAGCTSTATVQVINAAPITPAAPIVTAIQPSCAVATGTITVTAPTGTDLTYSIDGINYQASATFTNVAQGSYNVTVQNTAGCISTITVQNINVVPNAPAAPTVAATQPTCAVATGTITVTAPTGTGFTYSIDGINYQSSATFANLAPGSYNITVQNATGCTSTATVQVINAAPVTPAAPTVTAIQPTCTVATGTITVSSPTGTGFTYSIDGINYQASATFANLAPGSYNITVQNTAGCTSTATVQPINAVPNAPAAPTVTAIQPTCAVATGTITVTAPTGSGFTYSIDGINYQASATFVNLAPGSYNVTAQNAAGCTSAITVQAINAVPNAPVAPTVAAIQPTCTVATGTITITAPLAADLTYSIDGTNYQVSATFTNLAAGSYNVTVRNAAGCTSNATIEGINTTPILPVITGVQGCIETSFGKNYVLEGNPSGASFDVNTATFAWTRAGQGTVLGEDNVFNVTQYAAANHLTSADYPIDFELTVTTPGGCENTLVYTVNGVFCDIPKGISPNNDTMNDSFDLTGLNATHVSIFNRYGLEVYAKTNYNREWHGQANNGDELPTGTYFYVVEVEGGAKTGWVYVNRQVN